MSTTIARRRARDHRHDLRLLRQPDRAQAQQARRRHRDRQLRHREGQGHLPRRAHARRPGRHRRAGRVRRQRCRRPSPAGGDRGRRSTTRPARCGTGCSSRPLLTVPVVAMAMVPALQFDVLAVAVADPGRARSWCGAPGRSTAPPGPTCGTAPRPWTRSSRSARSRRSAGRSYALFWGTAGMPGMTHPFELTIERTDGAGNIYLEAAAGVTTFLLAGRYFEARSKRRAGAALRALLELGAKDVAVLRDGVETPDPDRRAARSATRSWSGPARRSPPTASSRAARSAVDASLLTGESVPVEVGPGDAVVGATRQRRRPAGRPRHPGRRRHPAGPDGPAGRGGPERQGPGAAAGRPDLRGLRAGRDRARRRHARVLARHRRRGRERRSPPRSRC